MIGKSGIWVSGPGVDRVEREGGRAGVVSKEGRTDTTRAGGMHVQGGAGTKRGDIPHGYPRRPSPLASQPVFPPPPYLSIVVVVVIVAVVGARTVAMLDPSSGSVSGGASEEQDTSAAEIVDGAGERCGSERRCRHGRGRGREGKDENL